MKELFYIRNVFHILLAAAIGFGLSYLGTHLPYRDASFDPGTITIFLMFVLAFGIEDAVQRHQSLKREVQTELAGLRRIRHLSEGMHNRQTKWVKEIEKSLTDYMRFFARHDFRFYEDNNGTFRNLTHRIYSFVPKTSQQEILFMDLLDTTRELAVSRQLISTLQHEHISTYRWVVLLVIEFLVVCSLLMTQADGAISFLMSGSLLTALFITTILIREVDTYSPLEVKKLAQLYVKNLDRLKE